MCSRLCPRFVDLTVFVLGASSGSHYILHISTLQIFLHYISVTKCIYQYYNKKGSKHPANQDFTPCGMCILQLYWGTWGKAFAFSPQTITIQSSVCMQMHKYPRSTLPMNNVGNGTLSKWFYQASTKTQINCSTQIKNSDRPPTLFVAACIAWYEEDRNSFKFHVTVRMKNKTPH